MVLSASAVSSAALLSAFSLSFSSSVAFSVSSLEVSFSAVSSEDAPVVSFSEVSSVAFGASVSSGFVAASSVTDSFSAAWASFCVDPDASPSSASVIFSSVFEDTVSIFFSVFLSIFFSFSPAIVASSFFSSEVFLSDDVSLFSASDLDVSSSSLFVWSEGFSSLSREPSSSFFTSEGSVLVSAVSESLSAVISSSSPLSSSSNAASRAAFSNDWVFAELYTRHISVFSPGNATSTPPTMVRSFTCAYCSGP